MFLETRRIPFLHPKSFRSLSKNDREMFFLKNFSSNKIYTDVKCNFFKLSVKKLAGKPNFYPVKVQKRIENLNSLLENIFRRSVPIDTYNTLLTTWSEKKNLKKPKFFCSMCEKDKNFSWRFF